MIEVLLVDDHALIRRGLGDLIGAAEGITVVGAIEDGRGGGMLDVAAGRHLPALAARRRLLPDATHVFASPISAWQRMSHIPNMG